MTTFSDFELAAPILEAVKGEGYTTPTPIQVQAIPFVLAGHDLLGIAQTGTGKTAAFALPVLHRLSTDKRAPLRKGCRALVLAPTRELAQQIGDFFRVYGRRLGLSVAVVVGGVASRPQIKALANGVDILVATPGRLLDHVREKFVVLSSTEVFILDEADQMLDLGFIKPIRQIASLLSVRRQCLLFSATMPREIAGLAETLLQNPKKVTATPVASTSERVAQRVVLIESACKKSLLVELLSAENMARTLIFTRTKRGADRVARHLEAAGIRASAIHGNKSQNQRQQALGDFKRGKVTVLVATDIAARGIDVDDVTHVVNFELPEVPEAYVHRIGRTARAGASGSAIAFCDNSERHLLRDIERLTKRTLAIEDRRRDTSLEAEAALSGRGERGRPNRDGGQHRGTQANGRSANGRRDEAKAPSAKRSEGKKKFAKRKPNGRSANDAGETPKRGQSGAENSGSSLTKVGFFAAKGKQGNGTESKDRGAKQKGEQRNNGSAKQLRTEPGAGNEPLRRKRRSSRRVASASA